MKGIIITFILSFALFTLSCRKRNAEEKVGTYDGLTIQTTELFQDTTWTDTLVQSYAITYSSNTYRITNSPTEVIEIEYKEFKDNYFISNNAKTSSSVEVRLVDDSLFVRIESFSDVTSDLIIADFKGVKR